MRDTVRSEYNSVISFIFKFVEIIVDFSRKIRSFTHKNNCDMVKALEHSVPKSSIISKSQSKIF